MHPANQLPDNYPNQSGHQPIYQSFPSLNPKPRLQMKPRIIAILICLASYFIACVLPVLEFIKEDGTSYSDGLMRGFAALVAGWAAVFIGQFAWLANIFWALSLLFLLFRGWIASVLCSLFAIVVALQTFMLFSQKVPANEGATFYLQLKEIKIGFYFWLVSFLAVTVCALVLRTRDRALQRSINF
ncbi:MAG: hypothetical protein AB1757_29700 [Acidobacteriota bacterium]